jgi:hypothetical protein
VRVDMRLGNQRAREEEPALDPGLAYLKHVAL